MAVPTEIFWELETLRLTAFPIDPVAVDGLDWWQRVMGSAPDQSSIDRRRAALAQLGTLPGEAGLAASLRLVVEPLRVQWDLLPPQDAAEPAPVTLGRWDAAVPPFQAFMKEWLGIAPALNRLAFGAVLHGKVSDRREGYENLARFLPFPIDPESSDFLFQTNKQVGSASIEGLGLNRLTKWSVATMELVMLPLGVPGTSPVARKTHLGTACRLELDINTAPERTDPLPQDSLAGLWDELEQLGRAIADEGVKAW